MGLTYTFDAEAHSTILIGAGNAPHKHRAELLYYPKPRKQGIDVNYICPGMNELVAMFSPYHSAEDIIEFFREKIHTLQMRDLNTDGYRLEFGKEQSLYFNRKSSAFNLRYNQAERCVPIWMMGRVFNEICVRRRPLYWGECYRTGIVHKPFWPSYEMGIAVGRGTSNVVAARRLRRFIRHLERFGLQEHMPGFPNPTLSVARW